MQAIDADVIVPTVGRASLTVLLATLARERWPGRVWVVDDRAADAGARPLDVPSSLDVVVLRSFGRGPAAARNVGWRAGRATWAAFLDDDVTLPVGWRRALIDDLAACGPRVAGCQGHVRVPVPVDRRPTDWERNVAGLGGAQWITADMAYRRTALRELGGFDERFPRAYREDADLALRARAAGWSLQRGARVVAHPVRAAPWHVSVSKQSGNADDALMTRIHGRSWRDRAGASRGGFERHAMTTAVGIGTIVLAGRRRDRLAAVLAAMWVARTARFAWQRIAPGPRTPEEIASMLVTSAAIPPVAVWHRVAGRLRPLGTATGRRVDAVLFDRDGTLVRDVPYNGDPDRVEPMEGARDAIERLRRAGLRVGIVTNQSGVARGLLTAEEVARVNARIDRELGPFDTIAVCMHGPDDRCACRKPAPGLILRAASELGVDPANCVVIGDIGADVAAAHSAGSAAVLVPTPVTLLDEVTAAPAVAGDLDTAVDLVLARLP